jgi:hypothetical protein
MPSRWRLLAGLLTAKAVLAGAAPAAAHELGPFQVYGSFQRGGAYRLEIHVDEEHLPAAAQGGPARTTRYGRIAGLGGRTEQRFGRYLSDLADSLTVAFDGVPVGPVLTMDPAAGGAAGGLARATLLIEGWVPGGARVFTFASSLPVKSYPLVLSCEGDESSTWRWVAGGETSPPYQLAARVVPPPRAAVARRWFETGFARVLPHGPLPLLLVAAIFLLARRLRFALTLLAVLAAGQALGLGLVLRGAAVPPPPALLEPLLALSVAGLALAGLAGFGVIGVAGEAAAPRRLPATPLPDPQTNPGNPRQPGPRPKGATLRSLWLLPPATLRSLWLPAVIAIIGALYGLDFAGAFAAAPGSPASAASAARVSSVLPPPQLPPALAGFTTGAAAAELMVLAAAFALVGIPLGNQPWYRGRVVVPACCLIAVVGLYWSLAGLLS